jgi:antirestriction protein ArdC
VNREIYAMITNRFIEKLKQGIVPWQKPWLDVQNLVSRKPYHGINALLLGSSEFKSPFWLSFKQALDLGGHVKKGERSMPVIYYKFLEKRDDAGNSVVLENGRPSRIPFVRWSNVFNVDQTEGITPPAIATSQNTAQPLERAAAMVDSAKLCPVHHGGFAAYYSPQDDVIRMPTPPHLSQPGGLLSQPVSRNDPRCRAQLQVESRGHYPAGKVRFGAVFKRGVDCGTRRGIPLQRSRHPGSCPVRELRRLSRFVDCEA